MDDIRRYNPRFQHPNDCLAFAVHLCFLTSSCKLVGLNEEQNLDDLGSIPDGWNANPDFYQFKYVEKKSNATILVKVLYMEGEAVVSAVQTSSEQVYTLDVTVGDHVNGDGDLSDYSAVYRDLNGLMLLVKEQIVNAVLPPAPGAGGGPAPGGLRDPDANPLRIGPVRGGRPGWGGVRPDGGVPFGGDFGGDLDPFGGGIGGIGGIGAPGPGGLMGPGHARFQPGRGRGRGTGPLPPGGVPGARFDPWGPGNPNPDHFNPPGRRGFGPGSGFGGGGGFGGII